MSDSTLDSSISNLHNQIMPGNSQQQIQGHAINSMMNNTIGAIGGHNPIMGKHMGNINNMPININNMPSMNK